ncbi:glycosyl hydrolase family protein [Ilyomonas limi]|uniref:Glycosyl hydrolase family protein n=1 Tax=Ilyomonas limi TaxID=2575867 RepID=A0A4U3KWT6_9BACT|nr:family 1 glycosylhydrolase [Ilyomonas limi]TKK66309.1 glycosyl hydrolase family protein [Ilyomonas limi]
MLNKFIFATGIENSYPTIQLPNGKIFRVDEMQKAGHYTFWKDDFYLVKELGIEFLRYGPSYYATHTGPGKYDWDFTDKTFAAIKELGITPIVDLCHFGVPDWIENFQNSEWPYYFAEYAQAFAERFPYLQFYTPVNEIHVTATFSALLGWWNERLTSDKAFVTALRNLCKANVMAMHAILKVQPRAIFIQSETTEYFHAEEPNECCLERAAFLNEKRFLSFDLTYGHPVSALIYNYLMDNCMTRKEYEWFSTNMIKKHCVMGNDYYLSNEHMVHHDGSISNSGEIFGYYAITHQYFSRYRLPVMHTETNISEPQAVSWLQKEWANVYRLKQDGVPIIGFTWYSLTDQVDWDTALRENNSQVNKFGLYDLDRQIRPVGEAYRSLISKWQEVLTSECYGLNIYNF